MNTMLYSELYKSLESVRWDMEKDIPWDKFDASLLTDEQARTIKMNAITEWSALPATEMFLRDNHDDSDFSAFMSVWFFEEQKHSLVLMEYLRRFKPDMVPTEERAARVKDVVKRLRFKGPVFEISALTREGCEHLVQAVYQQVKAQQVAEHAPVVVDPRFTPLPSEGA